MAKETKKMQCIHNVSHYLFTRFVSFQDDEEKDEVFPSLILPYLYLGGRPAARSRTVTAFVSLFKMFSNVLHLVFACLLTKRLFPFAMLQYLDKLNIRYILNMTPSRDTDPRAGVPNFFKNDKSITLAALNACFFLRKTFNLFVFLPLCAVSLIIGIFLPICMNRYRRVSVFDSTAESLLRYFKPCIEFIDQSKHHGSILVHCLQVCACVCRRELPFIFFFFFLQGVSRSSSIVIAYLMKVSTAI